MYKNVQEEHKTQEKIKKLLGEGKKFRNKLSGGTDLLPTTQMFDFLPIFTKKIQFQNQNFGNVYLKTITSLLLKGFQKISPVWGKVKMPLKLFNK